MILVDTSVLIDFFRNKDNEWTRKIVEILDMNIPFGITSHIYQELLQGCKTKKDFLGLKKYLDSFTIYSTIDEKKSYGEAAYIYLLCKQKGITINSTIDCIIFQIAREHNLKLFHNDRDFLRMRTIVKDVEFY